MKLTIWQFLALVLALGAAWAAWTYWGQHVDQNAMIRKMNGGITGDDTSNVKTTTDGSDNAEPAKKPW